MRGNVNKLFLVSQIPISCKPLFIKNAVSKTRDLFGRLPLC